MTNLRQQIKYRSLGGSMSRAILRSSSGDPLTKNLYQVLSTGSASARAQCLAAAASVRSLVENPACLEARLAHWPHHRVQRAAAM